MVALESIDKIVDEIVEKAVKEANQLTEREKEVLLYIAKGMTDSQIAAKLSTEVTTVESHIGNICDSLGVNGRALTAVAVRYYIAQDPACEPPFKIKTGFTGRKAQILSLVGRGLYDDEIAEQLRLSEGTVQTHIRRISATLREVPSQRRSFWAYAAWYAVYTARPPAEEHIDGPKAV